MKPPLVTNARRILNALTAAILDEWVKLYRMDKFVGPIEAVRAMAEEIRTLRAAQAQGGEAWWVGERDGKTVEIREKDVAPAFNIAGLTRCWRSTDVS